MSPDDVNHKKELQGEFVFIITSILWIYTILLSLLGPRKKLSIPQFLKKEEGTPCL